LKHVWILFISSAQMYKNFRPFLDKMANSVKFLTNCFDRKKNFGHLIQPLFLKHLFVGFGQIFGQKLFNPLILFFFCNILIRVRIWKLSRSTEQKTKAGILKTSYDHLTIIFSSRVPCLQKAKCSSPCYSYLKALKLK
jgi:hypothetical protein